MDKERFGFFKALLLQYVNPKAMLYAITIASTFTLDVFASIMGILVIALSLACIAFLATSSWALLGSTFNCFLTKPRYGKIFNWIMGTLLIYTALSVADIFALLLF